MKTPGAMPRRARHGALAWMAQNSVAANLLMFLLIVGGLLMSANVKQEVFPEFDPDFVTVSVAYPGASPEEVEQGIVLAVEEAVRGIDGVERVTSTAAEGTASVQVELLTGADLDAVQNDVKVAVDRIQSFPEEAERPVVSAAPAVRNVIAVIVHGDLSHDVLRQTAERVRAGLLAETAVTQTELSGVPPREIAVEVPQATLRAYGLTLDGVANAIRAASIELPGGAVRAAGGEVLVRTTERRDVGSEFADITLISRADGTRVKLGDIAAIRDGFGETDQEALFDGQAAVRLNVFRVGDQTPVEIAEAVEGYVADLVLPAGVKLATWDDQSEIYADRISLLMRNAGMGLALVMVVLGLFLEIRLAFWVMLGIPISFLGAFLLMPVFGASINMISMFAFLLVLGIVVDDAIVVGENIFEQRRQGKPFLRAAIEGVQEVASPIVFAVLTTVATFGPLLFVPGFTGKIFGVVPIIVIAVLIFSLVESLIILPAHLAHGTREVGGVVGWINAQQRKFSHGLDRFVDGMYVPFARWIARNRYLVAAGALSVLLITAGLAAGGFVKFGFFPKIESELAKASIRLPIGAPVEDTREIGRRLMAAANRVVERNGGDAIKRGLYAQVGSAITGGGPRGGSADTGGHVVDVQLQLVPMDQRAITAREFVQQWRAEVGTLVGVETQSFSFNLGPSAGSPIDIQISHPDTAVLEGAAERLGAAIADFQGLRDIDPGFSNGKAQYDATLTSIGRASGLTELELARQLRSAFFGSEALRQQRGRDEVKVMVKLPYADRRSAESLEGLVLRTPGGGEIPLAVAAKLAPGRAETRIRRVDGRRVLNVTADVDETQANANELLARIEKEVMPTLVDTTPGLSYSLEGEQREQRESLGALGFNFLLAVLLIYGLLAVPFRSYLQPFLVMSVIPFGVVGAVLGHIVMGYDLSVISVLGIVALSGVVVNDSLIMIVATNGFKRDGATAAEAVVQGGARRFRPILLTSLTTFFGLVPMIFETSLQARFLIPMAISLGFGVLSATVIVLIVVPAYYCILDDVVRAWRWLYPKPEAHGLEALDDAEVA